MKYRFIRECCQGRLYCVFFSQLIVTLSVTLHSFVFCSENLKLVEWYTLTSVFVIRILKIGNNILQGQNQHSSI